MAITTALPSNDNRTTDVVKKPIPKIGASETTRKQIEDIQEANTAVEEKAQQEDIDGIKVSLDGKTQALTALGEMKSKVDNVQSSLDTILGNGITKKGVFEKRNADVTIVGDSTGAKKVTTTAKDGASLATHTVAVKRLAHVAQRSIFSSTDDVNGRIGFASATTDITDGTAGNFTAESFRINYLDSNEASQNVTITLAAGDSLSTIKSKINTQTATTGVRASIVDTGKNGYVLSLSSTNTGLINNFSFSNSGGALSSLQAEGVDATMVTNARHISLQASAGFDNRTSNIVKNSPGVGQIDAGDFQINGTNITLSNNTNLDEVATEINAETSSTGVKASIKELASGKFILCLDLHGNTATKIEITDTNNLFTNIARYNTTASDAVAEVNGVTTTSSSNNITAIDDGNVTFELEQVDSATSYSRVRIEPNHEKIATCISDFMNVYDDLSLFHATHTERDEEGNYTDKAILSKHADHSAMNLDNVKRVLDTVLYAVPGLAPGKASLLNYAGFESKEIAATTDSPAFNILFTEEDSLLADLKDTTKFDEIKKLFTPAITTTQPNLDLVMSSHKTRLTTFNIKFDVTGGSYQANTAKFVVNGTEYDANASFANGQIILTGQTGTPAEGFIIAASDIDDNAGLTTYSDIVFTTGVTKRLQNDLEPYTRNDQSSLISQAVEDVKKDKESVQEKIEKANEKLALLTEKHHNNLSRISQILIEADKQKKMLEDMMKAMLG